MSCTEKGMEVFMPYTELDETRRTPDAHLPVAAAFEQVAEAHKVGLDVALGLMRL